MQSLHGEFAIHKIKTPDGRDAIMVVPNPVSEAPLTFSWKDTDESAEVYFGNVDGGENPSDTYLTLVFPGDYRVCLGPYLPAVT